MRRGSVVQLVLLGLFIGGAVTAVALLIPWLPTSASKERDRIDFVFWFTTAISIVVFSVVFSVTVFALVKFRARPDDDSDGPPIHGHTGLEVLWTAIPAALVTSIAVVSGIVLTQNGSAGPDPLRVQVTAQQFTWTFTYLNGEAEGVTAPILYLPLGRKVKLKIVSKDVLHSFWVPEFGQKQDAVPGSANPLVITPTKLGEFPVICTELCGLGHALMRTRSRVVRPEEFAAWARKERGATAPQPPATTEPSGQPSAVAGRRLFASMGCAVCHTLAAAGATGRIGPDLDKLSEQAQRAGESLEEFIRKSIVDPGAYIEPRFPNAMTGAFPKLADEQVAALVAFLLESVGGAK